jgi:thiamine pyrophosphate-dependent acetolactate synthase large subunit-like protein
MSTVGQLIVESLVANGIDRLFCVPGESYLGLLDALYGRTDIDTVACRTKRARDSWRSPTRGSADAPASSA